MDDRNLDPLLAQRREAPLPLLPMNFQQGVWREVRRRKAEAAEHHGVWLGWLLEPLLKPATAFVAPCLALALGVSLGSASADSRNTQTRLALDLQIFGSSPTALPATLLGYVE